jgi:hypothetical protein
LFRSESEYYTDNRSQTVSFTIELEFDDERVHRVRKPAMDIILHLNEYRCDGVTRIYCTTNRQNDDDPTLVIGIMAPPILPKVSHVD